MTERKQVVLLLIGLFVFQLVMQFGPMRADVPYADSWFHARYSEMLGTGVLPWHGLHFPALSHSCYADRPVDWALGWHWIVAPFVCLAPEPIDGLRLACVIGNTLLGGVFFLVLTRSGVPYALAWTAILHLSSAFWVFRTNLARPTPLAIVGLLAIWQCAWSQRPRALFCMAAVTLLVYQIPAWPLAVAASAVTCVGLRDRRVPWSLAAFALLGVAAGVVLHPGFWSVRGGALSADRATFDLWRHLANAVDFAANDGVVRVEGAVVSVPIAGELDAPQFGFYFESIAVLLATACGVTGLVIRFSWQSASAVLLAVLGLAMTCVSIRFFEYWVPFACLSAAIALRHVRPGVVYRDCLIGAAIVAAVLFGRQAMACSALTRDRRSVELVPAIQEIEKRSHPGDIVWNGSWDEFPNLFYHCSDRRWVQGFDPWFMIAHSPADFVAHMTVREDIRESRVRDALCRLGARFILIWRRPTPGGGRSPVYDKMIARMRSYPWLEHAFEDQGVVVFEMRR